MTQDGLYDWIADEDCSAQPYGTSWIDAMVTRRTNALEVMLRERLQVPEGEDLLQAALNEQFLRDKFNMSKLLVE